jgi:hypothetical protein
LFGSATKLTVRRKVFFWENDPSEIYCLIAETPEGEIEFPSPYFDSFDTIAKAQAVADAIGDALQFPVIWEGDDVW